MPTRPNAHAMQQCRSCWATFFPYRLGHLLTIAVTSAGYRYTSLMLFSRSPSKPCPHTRAYSAWLDSLACSNYRFNPTQQRYGKVFKRRCETSKERHAPKEKRHIEIRLRQKGNEQKTGYSHRTIGSQREGRESTEEGRQDHSA